MSLHFCLTGFLPSDLPCTDDVWMRALENTGGKGALYFHCGARMMFLNSRMKS